MMKEKKLNTIKDIEFILPICHGNFDILPYKPVLIDYSKNQILRECVGNTLFSNAVEQVLCFNSLDFSDYKFRGKGYYTCGFTVDPDQHEKQILEVFHYTNGSLEVKYGSTCGYAGKVVAENEELRRIFMMGLFCPNIGIVTANSDLERAYSTFQSDVSSSAIEVSPSGTKGQIFSVPSSDIRIGSAETVEINTINEVMPMLESNLAIQGGDYCLKGTRVTIQGILEAMAGDCSIDEMVAGLKKYFSVNRTKEELGKAIAEYKMRVSNFNT